MKKRILRYIKHILITFLVITTVVAYIGHINGAGVHYGDNPLALHWHNDGPYVFFKNDSILDVNYIQGNKEAGYSIKRNEYQKNSSPTARCYFPIDSTEFEFPLIANFETPKTEYNDDNKILAISDIESGYKAFRDFLINNKVIDNKLNWTFGTGHLVLVGDFVDRGFSTTQVLWFIYKLEQDAKKHGGNVHFILGNHELYNLQGKYKSASPKYYHVAAILEKQQYELYNSNSYLGRWMASKNTMELINGRLFTHGGIHPDLANINLNMKEINELIRAEYFKPYYPKKRSEQASKLISQRTSPSWYRGYYKEDLTQEQVDKGLSKFNAQAVIVGHTIQTEVNRIYDGKVIGIDVKHPKDYHKNFPKLNSEGLLIVDDKYYRVLDNGEKEEI